jgi:cytochrome P450
MPFGAGPRTCIGLSFALIEMQLIMAYLIPRYDVCIAEVDQVKPITNLSLRTNKDILMSVARTSIQL